MKKNILFITTDQQHWNTLGFLNPEVKTPNLDRIGAEGVRFIEKVVESAASERKWTALGC